MTKSVVKVPETIKLGTITGLIEGAPGKPGKPGDPGPEGKNAYEVWLAAGNNGTIQDYFAAQRGKGLVNKGAFVMGATYEMNDYVTAAGTTADSAIFFCKSATPFASSTQPRSDATHWTELVAPAGADGKPAEQRVSNGMVQYRTAGTTDEWKNLYALADVKGEPGAPGKDGENGKSFTVNASGPTASKSAYDGSPEGFAFLDTTTGLLYIKNTATAGDWSAGIPFKGDKGADGKNIELQKGLTAVQWRVVGATVWNDLVPIADLVGANGKNLELQKTATAIQWRVVGAATWNDLIAIADLTGAKGADGATWLSGSSGPTAATGKVTDWYLNITTGEIYLKTAATTWTLQLTLPLQSAGAVWLLTTDDPTAAQGANGQWALNSTTGTIWNRAGTTWNKVMSMPVFATQPQAVAATDYTLVMSPARVREYMESFGLTAKFTTTATDLNLSVHGEFFNYNATTLHTPGTTGYGRGITIPSGDGYATQFAIENDTHKVFIRYQTAGAWDTTWIALSGGGSTVTFASTEDAQAATALDKAMSPARTREYMEQYGITATYVPVTANLNTIVKGQMFNWDNKTTNTPEAASYGRGICIPAGTGYVTQIGIINDTGKMYVRFQNGATTWSAWILVGPAAASGGGGGGTALVTAGMTANTVSLNASSKVTIPTVLGSAAPDTTKIYKFSAVLLLQGEAGTVVNLSLTDIGSDLYRMVAFYALADGSVKRSFSTQDSGALAVTLSGTDSTVTLEGVVHSTYYGPNGPRIQGIIASGNWCNAIKGCVITMTPVVAAPAT